jgi:hypothetical protein
MEKLSQSFQAMMLPYAANSTMLIDAEQTLLENNNRGIWELESFIRRLSLVRIFRGCQGCDSCRGYQGYDGYLINNDNNDNKDKQLLTNQ